MGAEQTEDRKRKALDRGRGDGQKAGQMIIIEQGRQCVLEAEAEPGTAQVVAMSSIEMIRHHVRSEGGEGRCQVNHSSRRNLLAQPSAQGIESFADDGFQVDDGPLREIRAYDGPTFAVKVVVDRGDTGVWKCVSCNCRRLFVDTSPRSSVDVREELGIVNVK